MIAGDPFQLSRGQMMRVSVARALAPHPKVILLDEPFSALDALTRQQVQSALFDQIKADGGYGILVTHHSEDRPPDGECVCLTPFSSGG
jgi:ABC-type nitrate/sulfonate/bicarbonate transport system ATPase subunit